MPRDHYFLGIGILSWVTWLPAVGAILILLFNRSKNDAMVAGCGSGVPPRSAALDPSNANGPESAPFSGSAALTESPIAADSESKHGDRSSEEGSEQHAGHGHGAANLVGTPSSSAMQAGSSDQSPTYACPMHPELKSPQPGQCPKCGMKLVPQGKPGVTAPGAAGPAVPPATARDEGAAKAIVYTCPMHPEVTSSQPGKCPKCGMKLVPKKADQ